MTTPTDVIGKTLYIEHDGPGSHTGKIIDVIKSCGTSDHCEFDYVVDMGDWQPKVCSHQGTVLVKRAYALKG